MTNPHTTPAPKPMATTTRIDRQTLFCEWMRDKVKSVHYGHNPSMYNAIERIQ